MNNRFIQTKIMKLGSAVLCLALLIGLSASLSGCKKEEAPLEQEPSEAASSFPLDLSVDGESYTIRKKPQKIVSLTPDLTEALNDIGAVGLLAGVSDHCQEVTGISGKTCGTAQAIDMEAITAIQPNVVIASSPITENQLEQLAQLDVQVIQFSRPITIDEICSRYRNLYLLCYGSASGGEQGETFAQKFQSKLDALFSPASEYADLVQKKSAIYLADLDLTMATGETFENDLMEQMGLENAAAAYSHWVYPEEDVNDLSPDVIFYDKSLDPQEILESGYYKATPAAKGNQLFEVDFGAIQRGNLAMIDQLTIMAQACYPEAFSGNYQTSGTAPEEPSSPSASSDSPDEEEPDRDTGENAAEADSPTSSSEDYDEEQPADGIEEIELE